MESLTDCIIHVIMELLSKADAVALSRASIYFNIQFKKCYILVSKIPKGVSKYKTSINCLYFDKYYKNSIDYINNLIVLKLAKNIKIYAPESKQTEILELIAPHTNAEKISFKASDIRDIYGNFGC